MTREQLRKMPKVDLHCHLDGSLPVSMVSKLLNREVSSSELQVEKDCRNLAQYLEKFELPLTCLQTVQGLSIAAFEFMKSLVDEGIVYVEVRFAPLLSIQEGLSCREIIEAVLEGMEKGKQAFGISYGVIACAMRHHSEEDNLDMLTIAKEYLGNGICGVDLAGNEAAYPMHEFTSLFEKARQLGLPYTIHAGECGSVENVVDAVSCGAKRIGHGIALRGHKEAQELCKTKEIGIELCPTSNFQTKAVLCVEEYPIREFMDKGLLVTVNTDNRTVSNTTITQELEFIQTQFQVSDEEVIQLQKNAVKVSFATPQVKEELLKKYWR